jgi:hypothetical protein
VKGTVLSNKVNSQAKRLISGGMIIAHVFSPDLAKYKPFDAYENSF